MCQLFIIYSWDKSLLVVEAFLSSEQLWIFVRISIQNFPIINVVWHIQYPAVFLWESHFGISNHELFFDWKSWWVCRFGISTDHLITLIHEIIIWQLNILAINTALALDQHHEHDQLEFIELDVRLPHLLVIFIFFPMRKHMEIFETLIIIHNV